MFLVKSFIASGFIVLHLVTSKTEPLWTAWTQSHLRLINSYSQFCCQWLTTSTKSTTSQHPNENEKEPWNSDLTTYLEKVNRGVIFFFLKIYLLIDWLLCWVFVSVLGLPVVAASGGYSSSRCAGLSLSRPLLLRSTGSRRAGSVVVAHGPSCSVACGIFPDQGANPCPLH